MHPRHHGVCLLTRAPQYCPTPSIYLAATHLTAQVLSQAPQLSSLVQTSPASATPELLFLVLRLWHNLPHQQLQRCQLLPQLPPGADPPPQQFWLQPSAVERGAVAPAAAAVFSAKHVQELVPCLLATSASHPRLHPAWGCLLALLVPGFVPVKVRGWVGDHDCLSLYLSQEV